MSINLTMLIMLDPLVHFSFYFFGLFFYYSLFTLFCQFLLYRKVTQSCIYMYMYIYIYICIHTHTYINVHICTPVYITPLYSGDLELM